MEHKLKKKILSCSCHLFCIIVLILLINGCANQAELKQNDVIISRESKLPSDVLKVAPETDITPPKLNHIYSNEFEQPVPVSGLINTKGAEDSPFIMPDGNTLYFFFTPDVRIPVEKQILDGVTGIWTSRKQSDGEWSEPQRVILQSKNKLALDGCEFVQNNIIYFCSAREGYAGIHWFSAEHADEKWQNWKNADFNEDYKVGELHITKDGNELYFHSDRPGGKGGLDIWKIKKNEKGEWQAPENVAELNTERNEGWPALNPAEDEMWISRDYAIWRSKKVNGEWATPEKIVSDLAGEASIDEQGNVYFVHHFFKNNTMLEADIYVAKKK